MNQQFSIIHQLLQRSETEGKPLSYKIEEMKLGQWIPFTQRAEGSANFWKYVQDYIENAPENMRPDSVRITIYTTNDPKNYHTHGQPYLITVRSYAPQYTTGFAGLGNIQPDGYVPNQLLGQITEQAKESARQSEQIKYLEAEVTRLKAEVERKEKFRVKWKREAMALEEEVDELEDQLKNNFMEQANTPIGRMLLGVLMGQVFPNAQGLQDPAIQQAMNGTPPAPAYAAPPIERPKRTRAVEEDEDEGIEQLA